MRAILLLINRIFCYFDFHQKSKSALLNFCSVVFITISLAITVSFVQQCFVRAEHKDLWNDEIASLRNTCERPESTFLYIFLNGSPGQVSPAPLDYLLLKGFYEIREKVHSFGLSTNVYYRLNSIFSNVISGFVIVMILFWHVRKNMTNFLVFVLQMVSLLLALGIYLYWPFNFLYSVEMRPYALWNSLWFSSLALFLLYKGFRKPMAVLFIVLAMTVTASVYQLLSFILGFWIVKLLDREKWSSIFKITLKYFTAPMALNAYYYLLRRIHYGYAPEYSYEFMHFWTHKEMIPILSVTGILMTIFFKELRHHLIIFSTILILYLMSPLINYISMAHGYFFSSRHYIYFDLIYPIFLIHLTLSLPFYLEKIREYCSQNKV